MASVLFRGYYQWQQSQCETAISNKYIHKILSDMIVEIKLFFKQMAAENDFW